MYVCVCVYEGVEDGKVANPISIADRWVFAVVQLQLYSACDSTDVSINFSFPLPFEFWGEKATLIPRVAL